MTALSEQTIRDEHAALAEKIGDAAACEVVAQKHGIDTREVAAIVLRYQFGMGA